MNISNSPTLLPVTQRVLTRQHAISLAALCWISFLLVTLSALYGWAFALDHMGLLIWRTFDLQPSGPAWLTESARDISALGSGIVRILITIAAFVALQFMALHRKAGGFALTILSGWAAQVILKLIIHRPRPDIVPHLTHAGGFSFPSGHSFNAALLFITIALTFGNFSRRRSVHATLLTSAILLSLLVAWSRLWLGVHWPTDVMAGWLAGAGWAFGAYILTSRQ